MISLGNHQGTTSSNHAAKASKSTHLLFLTPNDLRKPWIPLLFIGPHPSPTVIQNNQYTTHTKEHLTLMPHAQCYHRCLLLLA